MKTNNVVALLAIVTIVLSALVTGCCDPDPKNSAPLVLDSTYSDTAIKDIANRDPILGKPDSAYYPIYSIDIKNTGIESDTFTLVYKRIRNGWLIPVVVRQFVPAGQVRTFRTEGPIPDHGVRYTSDIVYISFFVSTPDSIPIQMMKPEVTLSYGSTQTPGDESCGSPGETIELDVSNWQ